jgi:hypothetical protein
MLRSLVVLGYALAAGAALGAQGAAQAPRPPFSLGSNQRQPPSPPFHPGPMGLTPVPTPPVTFYDGMRPGLDDMIGFDQNRWPKASPDVDKGPGPTGAVTPVPSATAGPGTQQKAEPAAPTALATPDIEALGSLLDRLSLDQDSLGQLLAGRPSLDALDAAERSKAEAILADRDLTEQLLQARLQAAPLPIPKATPASARPLATPTPIP